ncbi:MAG: LiaF transmembrane domain-containing protein, partial [Anaerolineales bacterium]
MEENQPRTRRSVFIPIILIVIGVVLLLYNFGWISGDVWDIIFRLWPVILIAIGLDSVIKGEGLVGSIFIIGLGVAFLTSTLGFLDVSVWELILSLWPLLLIAIGLDIALGRRSIIWSLVAVGVFLLILIGAIWLLFSPAVESREGDEINQPIDGVIEAQLIIEPAVGNL